MYKRKYHKYKGKYLKLKAGSVSLDPNRVDPDTESPDTVNPDPDNIHYEETEDLSVTSSEPIKKGEFIGFGDFLSDDLTQKVFDIGIHGRARGQLKPFSEFDKSVFIKFSDEGDKNKILMIDNMDAFDEFTEKYGIPTDKSMYIKWDKVAKKYRGFYLATSALGERELTIPYKGKTYDSWVHNDYNYADVIVFVGTTKSILDGKTIEHPFKGKIIEPFVIDENQFIEIHQKPDGDKFLLINDVQAFDIFTNKYGYVDVDKLDIDWDKVKIDYKGFYIDKDNTFEDRRYKRAFFDGKEYHSWWKYNRISKLVVYMIA